MNLERFRIWQFELLGKLKHQIQLTVITQLLLEDSTIYINMHKLIK
jgi:hypothetical protein